MSMKETAGNALTPLALSGRELGALDTALVAVRPEERRVGQGC